jgi:hypothetical protein
MKRLHTLKNNYGPKKSIILAGARGREKKAPRRERIEIHSKIAIIIRFSHRYEFI